MDQTASHRDGGAAAIAPNGSQPRPWGFWATLGWTLLAFAAMWVAEIIAAVVYVVVSVDPDELLDRQLLLAHLQRLASHGVLLSVLTIVGLPASLAVYALAVRQRRDRFADYLALHRPRRGDVIFGVAALAVLELAFAGVDLFQGRELVQGFDIEVYRTSRAAGAVVLLFLTLVVAAPIGEEIAFRGFLFRGWAASPLGAVGTILVTSTLWSLMHVQYDPFTIFEIFCAGLVLGWIRWSSGSTTLTIVLHGLFNIVGMLAAAVKVELLS